MKISSVVLRLIIGTFAAPVLAILALPAQAGILIYRPAVVVAQPVVVVPQPIVIAQPMVMEAAPVVEYVASPADVYIVNAAPADVVFVGGNTYIWAVDANGRRYQRFYGRGDHRQEVFRRRDELHRVSARNGGHLPEHGEDHAAAVRHEEQHGAQANHVMAANHGPAAANHAAAPAAGHAPAAKAAEPPKKH